MNVILLRNSEKNTILYDDDVVLEAQKFDFGNLYHKGMDNLSSENVSNFKL